jgi:hypothetical protein
MGNGGWRVAGGEWRMANGEWGMANGEWLAADLLEVSECPLHCDSGL